MSRKTRYDFIKRKHKEYLILFYEKEQYFSYEEDEEIWNSFKSLKALEKCGIWYMVFRNVSKVNVFCDGDNQYHRYLKILKLKWLICLLIKEIK